MTRFGSSFSGIEAATQAFHPLGWEAAWYAEIELFPCAVLQHRYGANVFVSDGDNLVLPKPNYGDVCLLPKRIRSGHVEAPDVFVGGSPCQGFSVAGKRLSLDDLRSNLCLTFCEIADAIDSVRTVSRREPCVILWEQVPGVLSTEDNAFGCFLGRIAGEDLPLQPPGGRWTDAGCVVGPKRSLAWRILDAQYSGLAQRRKRVFVVASARDGFDPVEILLVEKGGRRNSPPRREAAEGTTGSIAPSLTGSGRGVERTGESRGQDPVVICPEVSPAMKARDWKGPSSDGDGDGDGLPLIMAPTLDAHMDRKWGSNQWVDNGFAVLQPTDSMAFRACGQDGFRPRDISPPVCASDGDISPTLRAMTSDGSNQNGGGQVAVAFNMHKSGSEHSSLGFSEDRTDCLRAFDKAPVAVQPKSGMAVRRILPVECERLQGFPDNFTKVPYRGKAAAQCPDGPRYKALGNSWAVPVVAWIGRRIDEYLKSVK